MIDADFVDALAGIEERLEEWNQIEDLPVVECLECPAVSLADMVKHLLSQLSTLEAKLAEEKLTSQSLRIAANQYKHLLEEVVGRTNDN